MILMVQVHCYCSEEGVDGKFVNAANFIKQFAEERCNSDIIQLSGFSTVGHNSTMTDDTLKYSIR